MINIELIEDIDELIELNKKLLKDYPHEEDCALVSNLEYLEDLKKAILDGIK